MTTGNCAIHSGAFCWFAVNNNTAGFIRHVRQQLLNLCVGVLQVNGSSYSSWDVCIRPVCVCPRQHAHSLVVNVSCCFLTWVHTNIFWASHEEAAGCKSGKDFSFFTFKESVTIYFGSIGFGCHTVYPWKSVLWTLTLHPPSASPQCWVVGRPWRSYRDQDPGHRLLSSSGALGCTWDLPAGGSQGLGGFRRRFAVRGSTPSVAPLSLCCCVVVVVILRVCHVPFILFKLPLFSVTPTIFWFRSNSSVILSFWDPFCFVLLVPQQRPLCTRLWDCGTQGNWAKGQAVQIMDVRT